MKAEDSLISREGDSQAEKTLHRTYGYAYIKANPDISLRSPKVLEQARIDGAIREICQPWFDMVSRLVFDSNIPSRYIINVDETPFGSNEYHQKVVTPLEHTESIVIAQEPRHNNVTVTLAVSLRGDALKTQVIWPTSNVLPELNVFNPDLVRVMANNSGYQTKVTFLDYMTNDILSPLIRLRKVNSEESYPIVVFLDDHVSRESEEFKTYCRGHNILPILYPPHTSHILQVLDQHVNSTLKETFKAQLDIINVYFYHTEQEKIPFGFPKPDTTNKEGTYRVCFANALLAALPNTLTQRSIIDAWKQAGLYNRDCMEAKIQSIRSAGIPIEFDEKRYLLLEHKPSASEGESPKQLHSGRKGEVSASSMLPVDRKPTSKPSIKAKQHQRPQKPRSTHIPDTHSKHGATYTTKT